MFNLLYLTQPVSLPTLLSIVMPRVKKEELESLSISERQKLQRLYTQGFAACGSVCNLAKAAKLSPSKVRKFLHSKTSSTRFTQATRKFKRMRAFARFKNEIWWMDLVYVDKLAKDNIGVKYLLVRQDLFDRTVDAKGMKKKDSKEAVKTFSKMTTKKNRPKKIWVDQGTEYAGEFKKFYSAEGIEIYSTMSETTTAFAEHTIRSLKNILYRYMEDYGYKYIYKKPQFIATRNSRNNPRIDMKPNHVKNSDFTSILHSKPLREYKRPKCGIGDRVRISKYDLPFRKGYKSQFAQKIFEIVAIATKKPPIYRIKDEHEVISGKFYEKSFEYGFIYNRVGFQRIFTALSKQHAQLIYKFLAGASEFGRTMGVTNSEISYPSMYQKVTEGKFMFYDEKLSKTTEAYYLEPGQYFSITDIVERTNTLIQERNNHREICITIKVSRLTQKVKVYLANEESSLAIFSTDLRHIFGGDVRNHLGKLRCGKGPHEPTFAYDILRIHPLMIYTDIVEYNIVANTKAPLLPCFPFISKLKSGDIIPTGQNMNYLTFSTLQFRRLLKNSFHSIHIDFRDRSGEKIPIVSVGITRLVLMFRKVSDIHLY